jgi:hypothetical protein
MLAGIELTGARTGCPARTHAGQTPPSWTICYLSSTTMNVVLSAAEQQQLLQQSTPKAEAATINFYECVPSHELSLDEFELFALKRLKVRCIFVVMY